MLPHLHRELLLGKGFSLVAVSHLAQSISQHAELGKVWPHVQAGPCADPGCKEGITSTEDSQRAQGVAVTVNTCVILNTTQSQKNRKPGTREDA